MIRDDERYWANVVIGAIDNLERPMLMFEGEKMIVRKALKAYLEDRKIENAPTIDAVSVERCKDCKYASDNKVYGCMLNHFNDNDYGYHRMYADDFCSRGERGE